MRETGTRDCLSAARVRSLFAWAQRGLLLMGLLGFAAPLKADPARDPKRLINNTPVNLSPLINWWTRHDGPRPLGAWVHLTGQIVGTNSGAWVVEAELLEGSIHGDSASADSAVGAPTHSRRVLLRNPPVEDWAQFERLRSRYVELNKKRASLADEETDAKARDQAIAEQRHAAGRKTALARVLSAEDKQLKQIENHAKIQEQPLDEELKQLKSKLASYPKIGEYVVDCFALDLRYESGSMAVYDNGQPLN